MPFIAESHPEGIKKMGMFNTAPTASNTGQHQEYDNEGKGSLWVDKNVTNKFNGKFTLEGIEYRVTAFLTDGKERPDKLTGMGIIVIGTAIEDSWDMMPMYVVEILRPDPAWESKDVGRGKLADKGKLMLYTNEKYTEGSTQPMVNMRLYNPQG